MAGADRDLQWQDGDDDRGLLDPDEVASLLDVAREPQAGIEALINSNRVSYERLPMLEVVFDRLVRIMTTTLRNFTSENVDLTLEDITSLRFGDYLDTVPLPTMIAVFKAVEWDNYGLLIVDSPLIYSIVDVLLGGRRGVAPVRVEGRPFTSIERALVERLIRLVLGEMATAFAPLSPVEFRYERLETNPRFAAIARPTNAAVLFKLRVEMDDRGGSLEVLIPYATLEPVRDLLLQMFLGEKFGQDSIWERHLSRQIQVTSVALEALLDEMTVTLGAAMKLEVGTTLTLNASPSDLVTLRCGHVPMLRGRLGRVGDQVAVQVEGRISDEGQRGAMLAIALDGLLLVVLLAALAVGLRIHQRLRQLRQDDGSLERLIADLDAATQRAELALAGLRRAAEEASTGLAGDLERLQRLGDDLQFLSDRAGQQADRLEDQIRRGRGRTAAGATPPPTPAGPAPPARAVLVADDLERRLRTLR